MKSFGVLFVFVLFSCLFLNLAFAEVNLPPSPPIPNLGSDSNSSSNELPPSPNYPPAQGNLVVDNDAQPGSGQSSMAYWTTFIGAILLAVLIAYFIIWLVRNKEKKVSVFRTFNRKDSTENLVDDSQ